LTVLVFGYVSFTVLLKKEGYPPIQFPGVLITSTYIVNDSEKVNNEITKPIYKAINGIDEIKQISTTTGDNYSVLFVQLEDNSSADQKLKEIKEEINLKVKFPSDQIQLKYSTINASSLDNENDYIFTISSNEKSYAELQKKAHEIGDELEAVAGIKAVNVKDVITDQINPINGQKVEYQSNFGAIAYQKDGELVFEKSVEIGLVTYSKTFGTIEISNNVRTRIDSLIKENKLNGFTVKYGGDNASKVNKQLFSLEENVIGGVVVVLIVLALLINWRASVVTALFIPTTLAATFIFFYFIGYSLNTISLIGLIIVLGLFVDDATVIVEAIDYQKKIGNKGLIAVKNAVQIVGAADIVGTLCTLLVFVPMMFISGIMGKFIVYLPTTVIIALGLSLIIALTVMPFLTNLAINDESETKKKNHKYIDMISKLMYAIPQFIMKLGERVSEFVNLYLSKKRYIAMVITFAIILISVGAFYATKLPFEVFPSGKDSDAALVVVTFKDQLSIQDAEKKLNIFNNNLSEKYGKYIDSIMYIGPDRTNAVATIDLKSMKDRDINAPELLEKMNKDLNANNSDVTAKFTIVSAGPTTGEYPFIMQIYSENSKESIALAEKITKYIDGKEIAPGVKVVSVSYDSDKTILANDNKKYINLRSKFDGTFDTNTILALQKDIEKEFKDNIEMLGFDQGIQSDALNSFYSTIIAFAAALIILYALLVYKFNSFTQPLLIFIAIPLSFPLVFPGLYYSDNFLSFFVMIGLIGLVGIVVNNTVMLLDFANYGRETGLSIRESIVNAVKLRFRPLIATSLTTIASLTPLALNDPMWESLALTIIFGLISSTLLVIFVFPAFYYIVENMREVKKWIKIKIK
jgi:multidrug efflux pump subunit AcrB